MNSDLLKATARGWDGTRHEFDSPLEAEDWARQYLQDWKQTGDFLRFFYDDEKGMVSYLCVCDELGQETDAGVVITYT